MGGPALRAPKAAIVLGRPVSGAHLDQPVQRLSKEGPPHGAPGQRQGAGAVSAQAPAQGPEVAGRDQQESRGGGGGQRDF